MYTRFFLSSLRGLPNFSPADNNRNYCTAFVIPPSLRLFLLIKYNFLLPIGSVYITLEMWRTGKHERSKTRASNRTPIDLFEHESARS